MFGVASLLVRCTLTTSSVYPHYLFGVLSLHARCTFATCSVYPHYLFGVPFLHARCNIAICSVYPHYLFGVPSLHARCSIATCSVYPHYIWKYLRYMFGDFQTLPKLKQRKPEKDKTNTSQTDFCNYSPSTRITYQFN